MDKNIKILSSEYILSLKYNYKETNPQLNELFESINSSFISSTNKNDKYKNIKFVKNIKKSTNKWKASLNNSNNNTVITIKNVLNKLCLENFDKISDEFILEIKIDSYLGLHTLATELYSRILMHPVYIDLYIKLAIKIAGICQNHWTFDNENLIKTLINLGQRKFILDYNPDLIDEFNHLLKEDFLTNVIDIDFQGFDEDEKNIKKKSLSLSNIKFLVKFYKFGLLDKVNFNEIIVTLLKLEYNNSIEALIEILNVFEKEDSVLESLASQMTKVIKRKDLDFRLKFIYEEAMKRYFGKKFNHLESEINNKVNKNKENKKSLIVGINTILDEYLEINEFEEIKEFIKTSINSHTLMCYFMEVLLSKCICSPSKDFNKLKTLFKKVNKSKNIKNSQIKRGFQFIKKNIDEYNLDYPSAKSNLQKLLDYSINQKIIKLDFYKEFISMFSLNISIDLS